MPSISKTAVVAAASGARVAVVGKGGAGKTTISGTLARLLARSGRRVLAVDFDTNPGLSYTLGLQPTDAGLPPECLEQHAESAYGWRMASALTASDVIERSARTGPDGVRYIGVGKIVEPEKQVVRRSRTALIQALEGFADPAWDVVADLEAGPSTPFERYHAFADRVLIVVGPSWVSALTARRLRPIIGDYPTVVVANQFRDEADHPGLPPAIRIPYDPAVAEADRLGVALLDHSPDSPVVKAIGDLAQLLVETEARQ